MSREAKEKLQSRPPRLHDMRDTVRLLIFYAGRRIVGT
jgi:hypothetical protein